MDAFERDARGRKSLTRYWRPPGFTAGFREQTETRNGPGPVGMPAVEPSLDRQIDDALELLRSVPFEELQRRGWHLQPNHFHWPLNDLGFLRDHPELWTQAVLPADIDWDPDAQVELLARVVEHVPELRDVSAALPARPGEFVWDNGAFPKEDAIVYYGLIRHLQPARVIEVGAGWSSLVLRRALAANSAPCDVTLIEPAPNREVLGDLPPRWQMVESHVQLTGLACFEALEPGDVLFYDGSHCVRTGSDVNWIFFEVLPRLSPGVWIHVHDIGWPWDYVPTWVLDEGLSWNEQYLVQAFLMGNTGYRVRLSVNVLRALRAHEVAAILPGSPPGSSIWIQKIEGATHGGLPTRRL